jgi:hypothetical protein
MPQVGKTPLGPRDEAIREAIKDVLGMSAPKFIAVTYGRSQKAAQVLFNQPETRSPADEKLLDEVHALCRDRDELLTHFIAHILGSDDRVLQNIQTTIDSRFQRLEADNTVRGLSRPMLSDIPEVNQIEMINDKYFYQALDMQREWAEAKRKQDESDAAVRIPFTHEQIRQAFETVIDMALLVIALRGADDSARARETKSRAYALLAAAAIQMGRYDVVERHLAVWRDQLELTADPAVPRRVRNLLLQKELWLFKRKGDFAAGLAVAESQWQRQQSETDAPRWTEVEPLACAGLELAALDLRTHPGEDAKPDAETLQAQATALRWLERFDGAPDRSEELGEYLNTDPELEAIRDLSQDGPFADRWSALMKKFGIGMLLVLLGLGAAAVLTAATGGGEAAGVTELAGKMSETLRPMEAGANPGKMVFDLLRYLFGM